MATKRKKTSRQHNPLFDIDAIKTSHARQYPVSCVGIPEGFTVKIGKTTHEIGPKAAAMMVYDRLRLAYKLAQFRDKLIPALFTAQDYGLREQGGQVVSDLIQQVNQRIEKIGFPGTIGAMELKQQMMLCSDAMNTLEREIREELDARPKLSLTVAQIGRLGKARCGTLLRKMPIKLDVTPEQEEAIRARYASLEG